MEISGWNGSNWRKIYESYVCPLRLVRPVSNHLRISVSYLYSLFLVIYLRFRLIRIWSVEWQIDYWKRIGKDLEGSELPDWRYYSVFDCGTEVNHKNLSQDNRSTGIWTWDLPNTPQECYTFDLFLTHWQRFTYSYNAVVSGMSVWANICLRCSWSPNINLGKKYLIQKPIFKINLFFTALPPSYHLFGKKI
jgi:hypothetical protein